MKIINYLFIVIALVMFSGCEKVMDLPERDAKKLTMDGIIMPDSTYVSVSLTLDYNKDIWNGNEINEYDSKRDNFCRTGIKSVVMLENDEFFDTLAYVGNCGYVSRKSVAENAKYTIVITSKDYGTMSASTIMPRKVYVQSFTQSNDFEIMEGNSSTLYMEYVEFRGQLYIQDPPEDNFYILKNGQGDFYIGLIEIYNPYLTESFLSDKSLKNQLIAIDCKFINNGNSYLYNHKYEVADSISHENVTMTYDSTIDRIIAHIPFELITISEDWYKNQSAFVVRNSEPNSEPIIEYSNVINGYGILGAINYTTTTIDIVIPKIYDYEN